jgi:hypothetical protein
MLNACGKEDVTPASIMSQVSQGDTVCGDRSKMLLIIHCEPQVFSTRGRKEKTLRYVVERIESKNFSGPSQKT